MTTTLEKVQEIMASKYSLPIDSITPESTLESLKLDSLDLIETLFDVEDQFHIRIPQDRKNEVPIVTVKDICDVIDKLIAQQGTAQLADAQSQ